MVKELSDVHVIAGSVTSNGEKTIGSQSVYARYFFVSMAVIFIIIAIVGFVPSYQSLHAGTMTVHWFVHVHGALMSLWLLIFFTQVILAAKGFLKFHRQLGQLSVVLGVFVWASMCIVTFRALIGYPPRINEISWDLLLLQLSAILLFGLFFVRGVRARKNAATHKRFMLLATLILIQAGIGRIQWLPWPVIAKPSLSGIPNPCLIFLYVDLLLIPLFIYDLLTLKRIYKTTLVGSACLIIIHLFITVVWSHLV